MINKKEIKTMDFVELLDAEKSAHFIYDFLVKRKLDGEYADSIAHSMSSYANDEYALKIVTLTYTILKRDYEVDLFSLPFSSEKIKLDVATKVLTKELENYFIKNQIDFEKNNIIEKGMELKNTDTNVKNIIDEIYNTKDQIDVEEDKTSIGI